MGKQVLLLNAPVITNTGIFTYEKINVEVAKDLIKKHGFISAIGHQSTAEILTEVLEEDVQVNRITAVQELGQIAIVMSVNGRVEEGKILNREELEAIGFQFYKLTNIGEVA